MADDTARSRSPAVVHESDTADDHGTQTRRRTFTDGDRARQQWRKSQPADVLDKYTRVKGDKAKRAFRALYDTDHSLASVVTKKTDSQQESKEDIVDSMYVSRAVLIMQEGGIHNPDSIVAADNYIDECVTRRSSWVKWHPWKKIMEFKKIDRKTRERFKRTKGIINEGELDEAIELAAAAEVESEGLDEPSGSMLIDFLNARASPGPTPYRGELSLVASSPHAVSRNRCPPLVRPVGSMQNLFAAFRRGEGSVSAASAASDVSMVSMNPDKLDGLSCDSTPVSSPRSLPDMHNVAPQGKSDAALPQQSSDVKGTRADMQHVSPQGKRDATLPQQSSDVKGTLADMQHVAPHGQSVVALPPQSSDVKITRADMQHVAPHGQSVVAFPPQSRDGEGNIATATDTASPDTKVKNDIDKMMKLEQGIKAEPPEDGGKTDGKKDRVREQFFIDYVAVLKLSKKLISDDGDAKKIAEGSKDKDNLWYRWAAFVPPLVGARDAIKATVQECDARVTFMRPPTFKQKHPETYAEGLAGIRDRLIIAQDAMDLELPALLRMQHAKNAAPPPQAKKSAKKKAVAKTRP